jgi:hypothetical protein
MKPWTAPTAADVKRRWDEIVDDMLAIRRNYWLNHEYFMGNQWVRWDDSSAQAEILDFTGQGDADTRVTVNKIKPRTLSLLARSTRVPLAFEPRPTGVDAQAQRRASIARQILDVEAHHADWEQVRADEVLNTLLGAVSAISVEPDWQYEPDPVTNIETGETLQLPVRPAIKLTALSAAEFGIEPGTRSEADARYWVRETTLTPEQAQERYDMDHLPSADAESATTSVMHRALLQRRAGGIRSSSKATRVLVYYERPSKRSPGVVLHVIGNDIVQQSAWPFPFTDRLNLAIFVQTPIGSTWKGETIMNDARQLQRNYNMAFTSINKHIGKADNARMILPQGAILDDESEMTGDVGEIIRIDPNAGEPHWMNAPQVPRFVREHIEKIEAELDDLFSTHAVSRGQAPGDRNSGLALSILAEKDETPLGPMASNQQRGWQRIAEMTLNTMRHLLAGVDLELEKAGQEPLMVEDVHMKDDGTATEVVWGSRDLPKSILVHVPLESVMPRSQAAIMDAMMKLAQSFPRMFEDLTPGQLAAVLRTPDTTAFATIKDPQAALANWENTRIFAGATDDEIFVDEWHDHDKHIAFHNDARASADYRNADPLIQQYIDDHIEAHVALKTPPPAAAEPPAPTGEMPFDPAMAGALPPGFPPGAPDPMNLGVPA